MVENQFLDHISELTKVIHFKLIMAHKFKIQ